MKNLLISIFVLGILVCNNAYSIDAMQIQKILAGDAATNDYFGYSVSISGDYAIVAAVLEDAGGSYAGAAYIYYRNQGGADNWGEVKKLLASDKQAGDNFGTSVSISGDYAIVGAVYEGTGGSYAGAAYMFYRNQGGPDNWGEVKKLMASDKEADDYFGYSVSISGEYAIVGAYGEGTGGSFAGAAYVFYKDKDYVNNWGEIKILVVSDKQAGDEFGFSVSMSGDYAIVGANTEDAGGSNAGAAYVFNKDIGGTDNWGEVIKLLASDKEADDWFGSSVSISGDYAVVGATGEDTGGSSAGAAYVFNKDTGGTDNWGEAAKLMASDKEADDSFGFSVSISGGYAIVGAHKNDGGFSNAGASYMFQMFPSIPTLPEWGMIAMGLLFAGIGGWFVFRRV